MNSGKVLKTIYRTFYSLHKEIPNKIVVTREAAVALCLKEGISPVFGGAEVEIREFNSDEAMIPGTGAQLGIFCKDGSIRACELKSS
jgi:hypothetical protein